MRWPELAVKFGCWLLALPALSPLPAYSGEEGMVDRVENGEDVDDDSMPAAQGVTGNE
jgi:hypothetical protein